MCLSQSELSINPQEKNWNQPLPIGYGHTSKLSYENEITHISEDSVITIHNFFFLLQSPQEVLSTFTLSHSKSNFGFGFLFRSLSKSFSYYSFFSSFVRLIFPVPPFASLISISTKTQK